MSVTRRVFLKTAVVAVAAGCGNPVSVPPEAGATISPSGEVLIPLELNPSLEPVGGALTLRLSAMAGDALPPSAPKEDVLVVHRGAAGDAPEWIAVDSLCTHLRCPLGYSTRDRAIECPCHASRFLAAPDGDKPIGTPTHLPATIALRSYDVSFDAASGTVKLSFGAECSPPPVDPSHPPVAVQEASGETLTLSLAQPELAPLGSVGGYVTAVAPMSGCDRLILVRTGAASVAALSSVCTHAGCDVDYDRGRDDLTCKCHGSSFDLAGMNLSGPAPSPLKVYAAALNGDTLTVTLS